MSDRVFDFSTYKRELGMPVRSSTWPLYSAKRALSSKSDKSSSLSSELEDQKSTDQPSCSSISRKSSLGGIKELSSLSVSPHEDKDESESYESMSMSTDSDTGNVPGTIPLSESESGRICEWIPISQESGSDDPNEPLKASLEEAIIIEQPLPQTQLDDEKYGKDKWLWMK